MDKMKKHNQIIKDNLHRSPLYCGDIEGTGPRYCPSIEDKVVRFADKNRHQVFIEPESQGTYEMYVQGMSTSFANRCADSYAPLHKGNGKRGNYACRLCHRVRLH